MFKLTQSPAYWWPVLFRLPSDAESGKHVEHGFDVQFKRLDVAQQAALMERTEKERFDDRAFSKEVVTSFRHVLDDRDAEVPFSDGALDQLLHVPGVATAVAKAYFASREDAPEKN